MRRVLFLTSLLILFSHSLFGQIKFIGTRYQIENDIPLFAAKYNLPDSTEAKLLAIFLGHIEQKAALRAEHTKDGARIKVSVKSPYFLANMELKAKKEESIKKLLGEKMFQNLEKFGYEQYLVRREEARIIQQLRRESNNLN